MSVKISKEQEERLCRKPREHKKKRLMDVGDLVKYLGPQGWIYGAIIDKYVPDASFDTSKVYTVRFDCGRLMEISKNDPWLTFYDQNADEFLFSGWLDITTPTTTTTTSSNEPTYDLGYNCCLSGPSSSGCCARCQNFFYPL